MGEWDREKHRAFRKSFKDLLCRPDYRQKIAALPEETIDYFSKMRESTTTRIAGGLDFTAKGGKRQGREVP